MPASIWAPGAASDRATARRCWATTSRLRAERRPISSRKRPGSAAAPLAPPASPPADRGLSDATRQRHTLNKSLSEFPHLPAKGFMIMRKLSGCLVGLFFIGAGAVVLAEQPGGTAAP